MPILTGEADPLLTIDPRIPERFDKLWKLSDAEQSGEWIRWKSEIAEDGTTVRNGAGDSKTSTLAVRPGSGTSRPQWLTAQVGGLILDRAVADPVRNLSRAARLARVLDDSLEVRPQELHFLIMLDHDLPHPLPLGYDRVVALALKVRRLAERAAMGVEEEGTDRPDTIAIPEVSALVKQAVSLGDEQRQRGQDLLFASDEPSRDEAEAALKQAESWYRSAISYGAKMRTALLLRDRVFSDLPAYTQWLLKLRFPRGRPQVLEVLRTHLVDLWKKSHKLNEELSHLDLPEADHTNSNSVITNLVRATENLSLLTTEVSQSLAVMKTDLSAYVGAVLRSPGKNMAEQCAKHLALTVLERKDRETLEVAYWEACKRERPMGSDQQTIRSDIGSNEQQSEAMVLTRSRALIALEVLGDHEFSRECTDDSTTGPDDIALSAGRYYQLKEFLASLVENEAKPDSGLEREADLRRFGKEIAVQLDCLVRRFNSQSRLQRTSTETRPARPAGHLVRMADDDLIRRIGPVSIFNADTNLLSADPVPVHRLAHFLERQARRDVEDRWYGEESRQRTGQPSPPYYERIARAFERDIKALGVVGDEAPVQPLTVGICVWSARSV